jgi:hypothetical protein
MSDKVELVAAAQVAVPGPSAAPSILFNSNFGFKSAAYIGVGGYILELEHEHDVKKMVIIVTANNTTAHGAVASPIDKKHISINFALDTGFFISVLRVRD